MRVNTVCPNKPKHQPIPRNCCVNLGPHVGPNIEVLRFVLGLVASVKVRRYIRCWQATNVSAHTCLHRLMHNRTRKKSRPLAAHPVMQCYTQIQQQLYPRMRVTDFRRKRCRCGRDSARVVSRKGHGIDFAFLLLSSKDLGGCDYVYSRVDISGNIHHEMLTNVDKFVASRMLRDIIANAFA